METDRLGEYFKQNNITTTEVAARTGYSISYVRNLLNGSDVLNDKARFRFVVAFPNVRPILMPEPDDNGNGPKETTC